MSNPKTYDEVMAWYKEITVIGDIIGQLHWDQRVNMPPKGLKGRSEQLAFLDGLSHRKLTDPAMTGKIGELAAAIDKLDDDARANVREIKREVDRAVKVPTALVEEISRHVSLSHEAWVEARTTNNFAHFAPFLEKMIDLRKQEAAAIGFADKPYDGLLDAFEPFATEASVKALLDDLRERLVPFFHKILDAKGPDAAWVTTKHYPTDKQRDFGLAIIRELGFDFESGRQDISAHPFTVGTKGDVRITTRYNESDFRQSLLAMIHEAGHAMYEQGLREEYIGSPLGQSVSLGVHESQSRFWENVVGRSLPFWKHFFPQMQTAMPAAFGGMSSNDVYRAVNTVTPSLIRVEADEVTYNLHIVVRFEIERAFIAGEVKVADLPTLWNEKMKQYLGIDVPSDADGVLQDVHWSEGFIGYFPTYTIGNLYSAQLREKIMSDLGDFDGMIAKGEFAPILNWLRESIHVHGKRWRAEGLIERATGKKPSAEPFMKYLQDKFGPLYNL